MQYLQQYKVGRSVYYSVYNSKGDLALITSNPRMALAIAQAFKLDPESTEVRVEELARDRLKRV